MASYRCSLILTICADGQKGIPHFIFKGISGGSVHKEVLSYSNDYVSTMSVQENAWMNEECMFDWIENNFKYVINGKTRLIRDSLKVHKMESIVSKLSEYCVKVIYVPGGCTGIAQPLDVGIMKPFKLQMSNDYVHYYAENPFPTSAPERRRDMYDRSLMSWKKINEDTICNSWYKSGPFFPMGPGK